MMCSRIIVVQTSYHHIIYTSTHTLRDYAKSNALSQMSHPMMRNQTFSQEISELKEQFDCARNLQNADLCAVKTG